MARASRVRGFYKLVAGLSHLAPSRATVPVSWPAKAGQPRLCITVRNKRRANAAPRPDVAFNPNVHDGLRTIGLPIDKTNWAQKLGTPPYHAYGVTAGVTFTFGGLEVTTAAQVADTNGAPIAGLLAAGEIVGGLYCHNYGSGTGLVAGVTFGRIAGGGAAAFAKGHS
jgi:tricarballylate dehydrogenase